MNLKKIINDHTGTVLGHLLMTPWIVEKNECSDRPVLKENDKTGIRA